MKSPAAVPQGFRIAEKSRFCFFKKVSSQLADKSIFFFFFKELSSQLTDKKQKFPKNKKNRMSTPYARRQALQQNHQMKQFLARKTNIHSLCPQAIIPAKSPNEAILSEKAECPLPMPAGNHSSKTTK